MPSKRPVKLLPEVMRSQGLGTPQYILIHDDGPSAMHRVMYKLVVEGITAFGCGYSHMEAMQNTARCVLRVLHEKQTAALRKVSSSTEVSSRTSDVVEALDDLCWQQDLGAPEFRLETSPHRQFKCVCTVSGEQISGIGLTLKQAKELAASNMMKKIKTAIALEDSEDTADSDATIHADINTGNE